jgi:predicted secreted protein
MGEESSSSVHLEPGQTHEVTLPGLGTAGYRWDHELFGPAGVVDVDWERGVAPGSASAAVGRSAAEVVTVRAKAPGRVTVKLQQRRHWETSAKPLAERTIEITVGESAH